MPMPPPPSPPTRIYNILGNAHYHGTDVSGARVEIEDQTHAGSRSFVSTEADSNFIESMSNVSDDWADNDDVLIAMTHDGRRAQKKITIDETAHPNYEDMGTFKLLANWGCCG